MYDIVMVTETRQVGELIQHGAHFSLVKVHDGDDYHILILETDDFTIIQSRDND